MLVSCGPSPQEKEEIATITCNILEASRNMDASMRIREVNTAREKLGEEAYLGKDEEIRQSITFNFCKELVLNKGLEEKKLEIVIANEKRLEELKIAKQNEEQRIQKLKDKFFNNIVFKRNPNIKIEECFIKTHYPNQICQGIILDLDNPRNFYTKSDTIKLPNGYEYTREKIYKTGSEVPYTGLATKSQSVIDNNRTRKVIPKGEKIQYFQGEEYVTESHFNPIEGDRIKYEFKSQKHAWMCLKDKIKEARTTNVEIS